MARPKKRGFDYYPKDVNFFTDRKIRKLTKLNGLAAVAVYDFLLCELYRESGYFLSVTEDDIFDLSDALRIEIEDMKKYINAMVDVDLFDRMAYRVKSILTSPGIQRRYLKICKDAKRKSFMIPTDDLLLDRDDLLDLLAVAPPPREDKPELTDINSELTDINSELTDINSELSTQSKVYKSIKEERKTKDWPIFSISNFLKFKENVNTTLKRHFKQVGLNDDTNGSAEDYFLVFIRLIEFISIEMPGEKINVALAHNVFCHLLESLSTIDKSNFTIRYLAKHHGRIIQNMVVKKEKKQNIR